MTKGKQTGLWETNPTRYGAVTFYTRKKPPRRQRLLDIERRLMSAEYLIDSMNAHVRKKKCSDVLPRALRRYSLALNAVRSAIMLVRNEQGAKHLTLFAGPTQSQSWGKPGKTGTKTWSEKRPHKWRKDCEGTPDKSGHGLVFP